MKLLQNFLTYLREAKVELKKVSWPNRKETTRQTILVVIVSLMMSAFLGVIDYAFQIGMQSLV